MLKNKAKPVLQKIKKLPYIMLYNILKSLRKIDTHKIVLISNNKKELSGNLLYIYSYLQNMEENYNIKVITNNWNNIFHKILFQFVCVKEISNAKYIFIEDFFSLIYVLKIRKRARLIQVWHACGAFKKVGYSRESADLYSLTHKNYTDAIVSSEQIIENYTEAFGISKEKVHAWGIPRTDLFFNKDAMEKRKEETYKKLPIIKNKKVILFAPTFRGNKINEAYYPKEYLNFKGLYENLKENEIFIIKLHPFVKEKINLKEEYNDKIVDLSDFSIDVNDLLLATDLLITDYSSIIFEYAFFNKPVIFYIPDYKEYKESRNFYYEFKEYVYGIECTEQKDLIEAINNNVQVDLNALSNFKAKFLSSCDGNSTKRVIENILGKERRN